MTELPDKLSAFMRMALGALAKCHRSPKYEVDMGDWHQGYARPVCAVCFAGSVMAQILGSDITTNLSPTVFGAETFWKLAALDDVRRGEIAEAVRTFHGYKDFPDTFTNADDIKVADYTDRLAWRKDMFKIVRMLEKKGL